MVYDLVMLTSCLVSSVNLSLSLSPTGVGASGTAGYNPSGVRLGYVDFVPRIVTKKMFGPDEYETYE